MSTNNPSESTINAPTVLPVSKVRQEAEDFGLTVSWPDRAALTADLRAHTLPDPKFATFEALTRDGSAYLALVRENWS